MNAIKKNTEMPLIGESCESFIIDELNLDNNRDKIIRIITNGLCLTCDAISCCVWKEDKKINCEHFE